jgi:ribosome-binding factor A
MNLSGSKNRLVAITKELSKRWDETKNYWRDAKSQEFEQRYMTELFANVDKTINVMDKLNELLTKVRKDCE